jgi:crotonobetainyl-CoA:carnitine CoA-transferase CaiB-like acyl-CoA transferase
VIAAFDDVEWAGLCRVIGRPDWVSDPRFARLEGRLENADEIDRAIERWTLERTPHDVMKILQGAGVTAGAVQTPEDHMHHDPQLAARGFLEEIEHLKKGTVIATGIPLGLTGTPGRTRRTGAAVGQDNEAVFRDLLGLGPEEIRRLTEVGAIEPSDG